MAIIRSDAKSTRAYRDSFSSPFAEVIHAQVPLEIQAAMLQARRDAVKRTGKPRGFRIVWDDEPAAATAEAATAEAATPTATVNTKSRKEEVRHAGTVGDEPIETAEPATENQDETLDVGTKADPEKTVEPSDPPFVTEVSAKTRRKKT